MDRSALFTNGRIYTLEREGECYSALRVGPDGRIAQLYRDGADVPPQMARNIPRTDLGGRTVVPGFIDSHVHFMAKVAFGALGVNLARLEGDRIVPDSLDQIRLLLAERIAQSPGPILGYGLCLGAVAERRLPWASELDAWFPGKDILILSMDGHSSSYSSPVLKKLGISALAQDGLLTGTAHEFNMGKISAFLMNRLTPAVLVRGFRTVVDEAARNGVVSLHCLEGTEDPSTDPALLLFKLVGGRLGLRLKLWMQYTALERARRHVRSLAYPRAGGCLAWEMDGSVSSRSAAFDRPYLDRPDAGREYRSPEQALALVRPFYDAGWQTTAHAIGPRGIESILSAYERVMSDGGDGENRLRLRIDHFEFPRPDQIERAGRLGLVLAVQPGFAWADDRFVHTYREALAPEVRAAQCPLRSLVDAGCVVSLSTDSPVQPLYPFLQILGAVDHPIAAHRLSRYEALRAYTYNGAYAAFEEHERGSLGIGKYADFVLLDADPFAVETERLRSIQVLGTWREGLPLTAPPGSVLGFAARVLRTQPRKL